MSNENKNLKILQPGAMRESQVIRPLSKEEIAATIAEIKYGVANFMKSVKPAYSKYVAKEPTLVNMIQTIKDALADLENAKGKSDIENIDKVIGFTFNEMSKILNGFTLEDTIEEMLIEGKEKTQVDKYEDTLEQAEGTDTAAVDETSIIE